ncbi:tRNA (adenosine(37)-N6)-threonylcarbamoyltransferase complex ATPase subunit type 1 TsaE [Puniceicoccaceae bacterium K14]|nr:tRNA (adenosine(37)-N6)-threonylcarbamoyltransferase complex ATPase subunit type 1 TsaE [Puniceicoccaceae bacterium K14]
MNILDKLAQGVTARSDADLQSVATELAKELPNDAVITLEGDLGAGKTTFVKGFAKAWNIEAIVTSPTYNIYQTYSGDRNLVHMDAYRLEPSIDIFDELMLEDFLVSPFCLAIEWPSKLGELPWSVFLSLNISITDNDSRLIEAK